MKITGEIELMQNQKHADVMAPDMAFSVLQTPEGDALFFSIGTDHIFYVTREVRASETGWTRIDLSSSLTALNGVAQAKAKSFSLGQNPRTLQFNVALVVTIAGEDLLYMSRGLSNAASDWVNGMSWLRLPFDAEAEAAPSPLIIADVYLMNIPSEDAGEPATENCFVDIIRTPGDPLKLLDRYYITPDQPTKWVRHALAADLKENSISSCLGHRTDDFVPGIYTYGMIDNTRELIYAEQYNYWQPEVAPNPSRLTLPDGATSIASVLNDVGDTSLFVAATGGLYIFTPDNQFDGAVSTLIVPTVIVGKIALFSGVSSLAASTIGCRTVVWALNAQGELFSVSCARGHEATPSAWSYPVPFCSNVERFSFYLNNTASNIVLFAHLSGQDMLQFTQNPATSEWVKRRIVLPATSVDDFVEYMSFTSHVSITDDNGAMVPDAPVILTSTSPISVYVNDAYHLLTPDVPIYTTSDATGTLTIVQETESLSGVSIHVAVDDPSASPLTLDPLAKSMETLSSIRSGDDLSRVRIMTADGTYKPLIPSDTSSDMRDAAAESIAQLVALKNTVSENSPKQNVRSSVSQPAVSESRAFSGQTKASIGKTLVASIQVRAGDFFNFLKSTWKGVKEFFIHHFENAYHFIVNIGGKIYRTILDCVSSVVSAIEFVFNKVKVFFEDLVAWLGYLFDWGDIKRTQKVMKHVIKRNVQRAIDSLDWVEDSISSFFIDLEDKINTWADITDPGQTVGVQAQEKKSVPGAESPQANWALYHAKNFFSSAQTEGDACLRPPSALQLFLKSLQGLAKEEFEYLETTITQIKEQVVDQYSNLTSVQMIKKVLAIISDFVLKTARNVIGKAIRILKAIATGILDMLDFPLRIPIISSVYKKITGHEMTLLGLFCFIGAIPATIVYKLVHKRAPYPDDDQVKAIIASSPADAADTAKRSTDSFDIKKREATIAAERATWGDPDTLAMVFNIAALPGSILVVILGTLKYQALAPGGTGTVRCSVSYGYFLGHLLFIAPNFTAWVNASDWANVLNDMIAGLSIIKTGVDSLLTNNTGSWREVSPYIEALIRVVWLVPAIGGICTVKERRPGDWCMFTASILFDVSGALTPLHKNPKVFAASQALNLIYGYLCVASGVDETLRV